MSELLNLLKQFRADERGVFGVIFAVMAIVLVALGGAVVDFVSVEQTRSRAQVALDAAALALQKEVFNKPLNAAAIQAKAQALVNDQIDDPTVTATLNTPVIDVNAGSLLLSAHLTMPTVFVALVGVTRMDANIISEATRKKTALEVVMVLDNSGSMGNSGRMTNLKVAAACATNILFYGAVKSDCTAVSTSKVAENVSIGIVPFTVMVNIGTQYKDAAWLDWAGRSSIARINYDNDDNNLTPFAGPVSRTTLFNQTATTWAGCVEARKAPFDTTDDPPLTKVGEEDTLFLPYFAPDGVSAYKDSNNFSLPAAEGNYISDTPAICPVMTCTMVNKSGTKTYTKVVGATTTQNSANCIPATNAVLISRTTSGTTTTDIYSLLSRLELQNRMCKYNGARPSSAQTNNGCPTVAVLPMTQTPKTVLNKITEMVAAGSTNIQQGTVWGMHALTNQEPMTEGSAKSDIDVRKALIIMTDGENDPPFTGSDFNGGSYFSWGFPFDGRLAQYVNQVDTEAKVRAIQDAKTLAACDFAKNNRNIEVFTIGLSSPSGVKAMLTKCSSGAGHYEFPNSASDLIPVFTRIANQLAPLAIAQ